MTDQEIADKVIGRMFEVYRFWTSKFYPIGTVIDRGIDSRKGRVISCDDAAYRAGLYKCRYILI